MEHTETGPPVMELRDTDTTETTAATVTKVTPPMETTTSEDTGLTMLMALKDPSMANTVMQELTLKTRALATRRLTLTTRRPATTPSPLTTMQTKANTVSATGPHITTLEPMVRLDTTVMVLTTDTEVTVTVSRPTTTQPTADMVTLMANLTSRDQDTDTSTSDDAVNFVNVWTSTLGELDTFQRMARHPEKRSCMTTDYLLILCCIRKKSVKTK